MPSVPISKVTIVDSQFEHLYPPFADLIELVLAQANRESRTKEGIPKFKDFKQWRLFEGYRSQARQSYLYSQGRTRPGNIVTYMKSPKWHGKGLAADIVWIDNQGNPRWDGSFELWSILGHAARTHGLVWGGDWKMKDLPHVEVNAKQKLLWAMPAQLRTSNF